MFRFNVTTRFFGSLILLIHFRVMFTAKGRPSSANEPPLDVPAPAAPPI